MKLKKVDTQPSPKTPSLLSSIKAGTKLKKVEPPVVKKTETQSELAKRIAGIRQAVANEDDDDNDDWKLRARRSRTKKTKKSKKSKKTKSRKNKKSIRKH